MDGVNSITKPAICVMGKEGFSTQGSGFVQRLRVDANDHFSEIVTLA